MKFRDSHIFVFILWKDLTDAVEKEYYAAVEFGIPILLLVKYPTHREARSSRLESLIDKTEESDLVQRVNVCLLGRNFEHESVEV